MTNTETKVVNSERDAWEYWEEEYGLPEYFFAYTELSDVEIKLADLTLENESLEREIKSRDVLNMNEYKINRAIELHFLLEVGSKYFAKCIEHVSIEEERLEGEFSRDFNDDNLFTRDFDED